MQPIRKFHMEVEAELPEFRGHENYRRQMAFILRSVADRVERGLHQDTIGIGNKTIGFFDLSFYDPGEEFKRNDKIFEEADNIFKEADGVFAKMDGMFNKMGSIFRRKSS
jgi:hypothetical protein